MEQVLNEEIPDVSAVQGGVDPVFNAIIHKALAKTPHNATARRPSF